ncbi:MAG: hypothetical protein PHZ19_01765 [Candidatus Thermoplasmatota archaeon]|nr:hypothetical protein [Candidatus Thermoplasmatota archaeon]
MTRALSTVAAVALLAAGAWWLLSTMAGLEAAGPAPDVDARLLEGSAATAAALAEAGDKPDPVTFSMELQGRPTMVAGARRQLTVDSAWGGVLEVLNQYLPGDPEAAPTAHVTMNGLGGAASITNEGGETGTGIQVNEPHEHEPGDPPPEWWPPEWPPGEWAGTYLPFVVSVGAGAGETDSARVGVWLRDIYALTPSYSTWLDEAVLVYTGGFELAAQATLTNVFARGYRSQHPPANRQTMDFTDLRGNEEWVGDENSIITVTATGPGGISLSAQGNMGYSGEVALGPNPFYYTAGFTVNNFPDQGAVYAQVSGLDTQAAADVWYAPSPDPANVPNVHQPNWSRSIEDADEHLIRVSLAGGTLNIRRDGTPMVGGRGFSVGVRKPYIVTLVPQP